MANIKPILTVLLMLLIVLPMSAQKRQKKKKDADVIETADDGVDYKFQGLYFKGIKEYGLENYDKAKQAFEKCLEMDSKEPGVHYQLSKTWWEIGDKGVAIGYAKSAFALLPNNEDMYQHYLDQLVNIRDYTSAVGMTQEFMTTLESGSKKIRYTRKLAEYLERTGRSDDALDLYYDLEAESKEAHPYALDKYKVHMRQRNYEGALTELEHLLQKTPKSVSYLFKKGRVLGQLDRDDEALTIFNEILLINPSHNKSLFESSRLLLRSNPEEAIRRYSEAFASRDINLADKVNAYNNVLEQGIEDKYELSLALKIQEAHPEDPAVNKAVSDAYLKARQKAKAAEYLEKTVKAEPNNYNYVTDLIVLLYELEDHEKLRSYSMLALELYPSQPALYLFSGIANMELEDYENAQIMLETGKAYVLGRASLKQDFELSLADLYFRMGSVDKASSIFDDLLKDNPDEATVLNNYAYFLARSGTRLNDAEKMGKKAVALEGDNASYLDTYGWVLFAKKDYKNAIQYLEKALILDPESAEILEHCGDAHMQAGNVDRALEYWKKAKKNGSDSKLLDRKITDKKFHEN